MKKTFLTLATALLSTAAIQHSANAQGTNNVATFADSKIFLKSIQTVATLDFPNDFTSTNAVDLNAVNVKAIKDFKTRFDKALNEKWYAIPSGFMSYFKMDGFGDRAFYDKKGRWESSLKIFSEDQLPIEVRRMIRSAFLDYAITIVEEVEIPDNHVYLIHLEDKTSFKIVRVNADLEMDVMQEFQKG
jgi:hypothetical protein